MKDASQAGNDVPLGTKFNEIWFKNTNNFIKGNACENVICQLAAISPQAQCVIEFNSSDPTSCVLNIYFVYQIPILYNFHPMSIKLFFFNSFLIYQIPILHSLHSLSTPFF